MITMETPWDREGCDNFATSESPPPLRNSSGSGTDAPGKPSGLYRDPALFGLNRELDIIEYNIVHVRIST